jgi:hypothetical protein
MKENQMPKPKKNESKGDFLGRCTRELIDKEGRESDQAYAMCNGAWDDAKGTRNSLSLTAPFTLRNRDGAADDSAAKEFMITAYTGQVIDLGFFGKFVFDVKGMKAKEKFPVLREHMRDRVVGIGNRTWKDEKNFYMGGQFAENTADGKEVRDLAEQGFPWQASVGIRPEKVRTLKDEKESVKVNGMEITGPAEIWMESRIGEVSFVALGADDQTAAIVLSDKSVPVEIIRETIKQEENVMAEITLESLQKDAPDLLKHIQEAATKDGVAMERARVAAILEAGADHTVTVKAITEGVSADGAFKMFYLAEKEKKTAAIGEMEASAPKSVGTTRPKDPVELKDPNKELMDKAIAMAKEKKISVAKAMKLIQAENPALVDAVMPKFHVVVNQ